MFSFTVGTGMLDSDYAFVVQLLMVQQNFTIMIKEI